VQNTQGRTKKQDVSCRWWHYVKTAK